MSQILTPNVTAKEIVALVKQDGWVTGYKLSDDTLLSKDDGVLLAKQGGIKGVGMTTNLGN